MPPQPTGACGFRLHHYFRVWSSEECLQHVAKGEEVRFGVEVTEEWHNPPNGVIGDTQDLIALGSHAVPIVDYDYETSRFVFPNSWGPKWGQEGWGSLSRQYFDQRIVEGWCRVGAGIFAPVTSTSGLVCLLWKSAAGGGEVHGREIVDAGSGDRLAWAFAVRRGDYLDVEELFVWPTFRRRGYARKLAELLRDLAAAMSLQLRAWIPFADCDPPNRSGLVRTLELLGLNLHPIREMPSGNSAAAQVRVCGVIASQACRHRKKGQTIEPKQYMRSDKTVNNAIHFLSCLWSLLRERGLAMSDPWENAPRPQPAKKAPTAPTEADVTNFFAWLDAKRWEFMSVFLRVKAVAGCRAADLCQVDARQFDPKNHTLTIFAKQDETNRERHVPLPENLSKRLDAIKGSAYLWEGYTISIREHTKAPRAAKEFKPERLAMAMRRLTPRTDWL